MPHAPLKNVLDRLRSTTRGQETDGQLLGRYVRSRDELAFELLVRRHGPMVLGVCRRLLLTPEDAEDAFQATFLVLARKAASVHPRERVGPWLHGVAYLAARKARAAATRLRAREKQVRTLPEPATVADGLWTDLAPLLDQELARLPEKYRLPLVLCDLQGRTRAEAARHLGWPEGTVAGRLARGRAVLAKRLTRLGLPLSAGVLTAVLSQNASACVPLTLAESVAKRICSGPVIALAEGVLKAMLFTRLKSAIAVVLILGFVATGATLLTCRSAAGQDDKEPTAEKPVEPAAIQEEAFTAWGKEVRGLQAGLGFRAGEKRPYRHGETVRMVIRVRNVSKEAVKFSYLQPFIEHPPTVTDGDGKPVPQTNVIPDIGEYQPGEVELPPGKEIELHELKRELRPAKWLAGNDRVRSLFGAGKFIVQYEQVLGDPEMGRPGWRLDPVLSKLATGRLDLEVKEAEKVPAKEEKEGFTAWGREVGGLQAGLAYRPGQHRTYNTGETAKLVVRVRNVSKEPVKFQYIPKFFVENPPTVTDGDGKQVHFRYGVIELTKGHSKVDVNLAPGKESELGEVELLTTLLGTGKFTLQYERVFANTWGATITLDPALSKLATGKLELDVKDADKQEKEGFTAWGEAVGGLQAGLVLPAEGKLTCRVGDKVAFAVKVRNVGKGPAKVYYYADVMRETPATAEDADGKRARVAMPPAFDYYRVLTSRTLEAGETFDLGTQRLTVGDDGKDGEVEGPTLVALPGWYKVSYHGVAQTQKSVKDPGLLATGQVSLMVKERASSDAAWGKAVGGFQAGVAFRKGQRRPYHLGEVVTLVVWVRNVSDKPLAFDYTDGYMVETPPTVKDAEGKPAKLSQFPILAGLWRPLHATLRAGEEFEMGSLQLALEEAGGKDAGQPTLYASPGKYRISYEGLPPFGFADPARVLSTGQMELEVKAKSDLEGTWKAVSFEQDSRALPQEEVKEIEATFSGDSYRFTSGLRAAGSLSGTLAVDTQAKPPSFEITPKAGVYAGKAFRGIYRRDGDTLTLCFSWPPKDRPTDFVSPPNSTVVLAVFKRQKP